MNVLPQPIHGAEDTVRSGDFFLRWVDSGSFHGNAWMLTSGFPNTEDKQELWRYARRAAHILWEMKLETCRVLRIQIREWFYQIDRND